MVPISAANAEPERPITTIAVTKGPSSRVMGNRNHVRDEMHGAETLQLVCALQRHYDADEKTL